MQDENHKKLIETKEKCLKILYERYEKAFLQMTTTLNDSDKPSLEQQCKEIWENIEKTNNEIEKLKLNLFQKDSEKIHNCHSRIWDKNFPKIDFNKTNKILKSTLEKFDSQEGAALFLLQNSRSMGGYWCIKNIKSQLENLGSCYRPCEFEFLSHQEANPMDFLNYLAQTFVVPHCDEISKYANEIINKICASLRSGNIFLIQIEIYDLDTKNTFLNWFVDQFWCKLLNRLPEISQKEPLIRFVAVLSVRGSIPKDFLTPDRCCKSNNFDSTKFVVLPLKKWTSQEIRNWLIKFSGLTDCDLGVPTQKIELMAQQIHKVTDGRPCEVYSELMEAMSKLVG